MINIILRKDYKGIEAGGTVGFSEGANDYRANLVAGFGDLGKDKYNVFGVFDYYKRDDLLAVRHRSSARRATSAGEDGGRNFQSLTGGGTWRQLTATGALTNNHRAISSAAAPS